MTSYIRKNKWTILLLLAFISISSWYFLNSRNLYEEPDKADLVLLQKDIN